MKERSVSFIIVNYNGIQHLKECFDTIKKLDYPKEKIECIMVDNGSSDGSVQFIEENYSYVKIIKNDSNEGFAKPNNDAAKIATGDYLALINNDMRIDKDWLNAMFKTLDEASGDESYACVGSKIINWNGTKLDFAGGSINFAGYGYQFDYGMDVKEAELKYSEDRDILFACGGALLIDRNVFLKVGGFDEDYFAYYEDVDLGWRLWILGYKVRFCAKAKCYHKHNGTSKKFNTHKMKTLFERNALYTIYKNYSQENFDIVLCNLFLLIQRIQMDLNINDDLYDITNNKDLYFEIDEKKDNYSSIVAINNLSSNLERLNKKRQFIQENRKIKDTDISELLPNPLMPFPVEYYHDYKYLDKFQKMINNYNVEEKLNTKFKRKILLISNEPIGKKMAGPGIRYLEFAKGLCKDNDVALAIPNKSNFDKKFEGIELVEYELGKADALIKAAWESDIIILQGLILELIQELKSICKQKILVVDIYDPFVIEILETYKNKNINNRVLAHNQNLRIQNEQLQLGDYFICANDKQMDMWIGMLTALNKVNPYEYDMSPKLERLIDLVPFGISNEEPIHTKDSMKEKIPNLKKEDKILLWGGGIWNWFDPITLIKSVYEISKKRTDIKLFFMGVKHPNPAVPEMEVCGEAIKLSEKLGIKDKYVFFNMDWVDYLERQNFLLESFAGVSCHLDNLETRFSFRTRILDYLWARLPIIATEGDYFADLIQQEQLGIVVKYKNVESLTNAILKLADDKEFFNQCKKNINVVREKYKWSVVMKPLVDFCNAPLKKKNANVASNSNYIIDLEQKVQDSVVGQLVTGRKIGQKFRCRYPNFASIEVKIATYDRINDHKIIFKLYDFSNNEVLVEKELEGKNLIDNSWITIEFKPIINSEGREFYFYFEGLTDEYDNCITIWKNKKEDSFGSIWENSRLLEGSLVYRTKCIYSVKGINPKNGIMLSPIEYDESDFDENIEESFDSLKNNSDGNDLNEIIIKKLKRLERLEKKVKAMENSLSKKELDINRLSSWMEKIDKRLRRISKLNIFSLFRRIFKK
ncbi:putative glycosyltransferase [Clostridium pasteurianum DSM 525 = ATCC 6013]|uniref:Glycosyl transferase family 2 n=1 Tax=Clostridium pasteurianum DSM 525 = ATCC 6013 TaxID=1262449 RepID=A0A0H3J786_CLOPA|nr:glycosyltransferase [Clostridium pasteurianum]AJA47778.1 putative glycosyltransferase [Clostridium pasteurianum DSM 525 = ATCC 6013]AJA51766.1 putative glycosyltransferase [Clostridium pasteurianum DSM 525 = ATCC 6013]AOZ75075.1 glycosyl transferase [Clostridium pasteurianum DSM 525 = ATCC 6013]AOZ78870.1 glycosyl transferase [Clostridium pasteurianum]ELP59679.1 Glycosyltransferase domain containing protein [Clostridium pasteurianum DSM 525 = ATCC 6013]